MHLLILVLAGLGSPQAFKAFADTGAPTLPKEDSVGSGYRKAYDKLMNRKTDPKAFREAIEENVASPLKEQGEALKKQTSSQSKKSLPKVTTEKKKASLSR